MSEAIFRFTLAEVEAHRKELADAKAKLAEWQAAHAELLAQWKEQCEQTRHFASMAISWRQKAADAGVPGAAVDNGVVVPPVAKEDTRQHVATRRDANGRRFWDGLGWTDNLVAALDGARLDLPTLTALKPRGSKLVAVDDVPALLAADAAKPTKEKPAAPTKPTPVRVQVSPSAQGFSTGAYVVRLVEKIAPVDGADDATESTRFLDEDGDTGPGFFPAGGHAFESVEDACRYGAEAAINLKLDGDACEIFIDRIAPEVTDGT